MSAYYNEVDPYAAQWLRNLVGRGLIAAGDVDQRGIVDVRPDDLRGYSQCHFFAGIGGWSYALRLAGFPDDGFVWTGSCPCQPFSAAGKGAAADDERHLWPAWFSLIRECRPAIVFGEQVEAAIGWGWLDAVFADLEAQSYACGAAVLPACGVGAPHIRQRLWFVAQSASDGRNERWPECERQQRDAASIATSGNGLMAHPNGGHASAEGLQRSGEHGQREEDGRSVCVGNASRAGLSERERDRRLQREAMGPPEGQTAECGSNSGELVNSASEQVGFPGRAREPRATFGGMGQPNSAGSFPRNATSATDRYGHSAIATSWTDCDWLPCTDGKARPVESGTFPLVAGSAFKLGSGGPVEGKSRVGMLRAYGNAIVPPVAAEFIKAFMEC